MAFVNTGAGITAPFNGYFTVGGVCRVHLSGTGPSGSLVYVVSRLFNLTTGVEVPTSRCLAALTVLDSANQGHSVQVSSPVSVPTFNANSGNVIELQIEPHSDGGSVVGSYGIYNDINGATVIYLTSQQRIS